MRMLRPAFTVAAALLVSTARPAPAISFPPIDRSRKSSIITSTRLCARSASSRPRRPTTRRWSAG